MNLYPAIDLKNGHCIRLKKGQLNKITYYNSNPVEQAKEFNNLGSKWIHMVDIDGAFKGKNLNHNTFIEVKKKTKCSIQVGGGIRNEKTVSYLIDNNIDRIVLGTIAVTKPSLVKKICKSFPNKIAVGLDSKKGYVATEGWSKTKNLSVLDLAKKYEDVGVSHIIFTDIEKDGILAGVSFEQLGQLLESTSLQIIASGGVSSLEDIKNLKKISKDYDNLDGVIVGRAIYEKIFTVDQAINILKIK
tara:strand:+ start:3446 stop:4180 length:735 start_codon:yes stop_codon:yes gene_type:complete